MAGRPAIAVDERLGEEWRRVRVDDVLTSYEVSSLGRVRRGWRLLSTAPNNGLPYVWLSASLRGRNYVGVHVLVAGAFLGPTPAHHRIAFRDGDRSNPAADNLHFAPIASHHKAPPRLIVRHSARSNGSAPVLSPTFTTGLDTRPDCCPRCGAPVAHEPGFVHCLMCGRLFPVRGGHRGEQAQYEAQSGLSSELYNVNV